MAYNLEIERKYLCYPKKVPLMKAISMNHCVQFYLLTSNLMMHNKAPSEVRVVVRNDMKAEITIKSTSDSEIRDEFSFPISVEEAHQLEKLKMGNTIYKDRYFIPMAIEECIALNGKTCWEVDVYKEQEAGLVIAEVEIPEEIQNNYTDVDGNCDIKINPPNWIDYEITNDAIYKNSQIARKSIMGRQKAIKALMAKI